MDVDAEYIDKYLSNELSEEEVMEVEERLATDDSFAQQVEEQRRIREGVRLNAWSKTLQVVEEELEVEGFFQALGTHNEGKPPDGKITRPAILKMRVAISIAAGVLLLLAIGISWWAGKAYSNVALAQSNFEEELPGLLRKENIAPSPFRAGLDAYEQEDWEASIQSFEAVPENSPQFIESRYYLGQAFFQQGNFHAAANNFEIVQAAYDVRFRESADWMLLLSLLATEGQGDRFFNLLSRLESNPQHAFHQKAIQLRDKLNSFWRQLVF